MEDSVAIPESVRTSIAYKQRFRSDVQTQFDSLGTPEIFGTWSVDLAGPAFAGVFDNRRGVVQDVPLFCVVYQQEWTRIWSFLRGRWSDVLLGGLRGWAFVVEYQNRGAPHVHFVLWSVRSLSELIEQNDKGGRDTIISCEAEPKDPELWESSSAFRCIGTRSTIVYDLDLTERDTVDSTFLNLSATIRVSRTERCCTGEDLAIPWLTPTVQISLVTAGTIQTFASTLDPGPICISQSTYPKPTTSRRAPLMAQVNTMAYLFLSEQKATQTVDTRNDDKKVGIDAYFFFNRMHPFSCLGDTMCRLTIWQQYLLHFVLV